MVDLKAIRNYEAHLFDMDGTLVNLEELNRSSIDYSFKLNLGLEVTMKLFLNYMSGAGSNNGIKNILKYYGVSYSEELFADLKRDYRDSKDSMLEQEIDRYVKLNKGAFAYLHQLANEGKFVALVTSTQPKYAELITKHFEIRKYFNLVLAAGAVVENKPSPMIFNEAIRMSGFRPEQCVAYEDSKNGLISAQDSDVDLVVGFHLPQVNDWIHEKVEIVIDDYNRLI